MDTAILTEAEIRAKTLVSTGEKHCRYTRVTDHAKEYAAHITGEGIDKFLKRYTIRESEAMFKQRCELTNSISPAVANSLMKPFSKVSRNNNVTKKYDFKTPALNSRVDVMLNDFNSDMMDSTNGLDMWLRTRFVELTFIDPNSFVVIEWDAATLTQTIKPRPFEVSSFDAFNYEYKGQILQWLFVRSKIKYNAIENNKTCAKDGVKYTYYGKGVTIVYEQVDKRFQSTVTVSLMENQRYEDVSGIRYMITVHDTKLNYVPAFKIGYMSDLSIESTGKSYVNPFNPAMSYFRKILKTNSELDITATSHVFPQKWQYVQKCNGASPTEPCDNGRCPTRNNEVCTACNGEGTRVLKSAQEVYFIPLPENPNEAMDLDKMQSYKSPPIDLVRWQDEYVRKLKQDTHLAVYNSNMFLANDPQFSKTATEIDANMEGVYDAIEPYTEQYSKVWKMIVYTCAVLGGFNQDSNDFDLVHTFPADPKLKTLSILLGDLKMVNDSDAPSFTRDIINNDIAEVVFNGDEEALTKYKVRHDFFPFNGKRTEEITMLLSTSYVSEFTKVLYSNFEAIFNEIDRENPNFYLLSYLKQWDIVSAKVEDWKAEIVDGNIERPSMDILINGSGGNNGNNDTSIGDNGAGSGSGTPEATAGVIIDESVQ